MALSFNAPLSLTPQMRHMALRFGLVALVLAAAAYVLVVMPYLESRKLDADMAAERSLLERHQKLMPAMASLMSGTQNATLKDFTPPKPAPTPRAQAYLITEQLGQMAIAAGLEPLDVSLNMNSLAQTPNSLQVQGVFSGQMDGVRSFLISLNGLASLTHVEKVEVRAVEGRLEMMLQARIALSD